MTNNLFIILRCHTYPPLAQQQPSNYMAISSYNLGIHPGLLTRTGAARTSHHFKQVGIRAATSHLLKTSNEITSRDPYMRQIIMHGIHYNLSSPSPFPSLEELWLSQLFFSPLCFLSSPLPSSANSSNLSQSIRLWIRCMSTHRMKLL